MLSNAGNVICQKRALGERWGIGFARYLLRCIALADSRAVDDYMSPDFVDHSAPPGLPADREGVKMQFTLFFAALPDLHAIIHDQVAELMSRAR